jgi:hypothetical protein
VNNIIRLSKLYSQPNHQGSYFITPIGVTGDKDEELWSARIMWGTAPKSEGEVVEVSLLSPNAPKLSTGQFIKIMEGAEVMCEGIVAASSNLKNDAAEEL